MKNLMNSMEKHRLIFENVKEGISIYEELPDGRRKLVECNPQYVEMSGYSYEQLTNLDDTTKIQINLDSPEKQDESAKKQRNNEPFAGLFSWIRPDGKENYVEYTAVPLILNDKRLTIGIDHDITERRKAEEQIRLTQFSIDHTFDAVFWIDASGKFIYVNESACHTLGYSRDELLNMSVHEVNPNFYAEEWYLYWQRLKEMGSVTRESRHRTKDGRIFPIEFTANYLYFDDKEFSFAFARDITERKRSEELNRIQIELGAALNARIELSEAMTICLEAVTCVPGIESGGIFLINEKTGDVGLSAHKGLSAEFIRMMSSHKADSTKMAQIMTGNSVYINYQKLCTQKNNLILNDGLKSVAVIPILYEGKINACLNVGSYTLENIPAYVRNALEAIATQIGSAIARLKAEEAMRKSEERFRTLIENSWDAFELIDAEGNVFYTSPAAARFSGYTVQEMIGRNVISRMVPEYRDYAQQLINDLIQKPGHTVSMQLCAQHKNGSLRWLEGVCTSMLDDPNVLAIVVNYRDVTEKRKIEESLLRIQKLESIGTLAGGIAHDFNNILTGILGNISLAEMLIDQKDKALERLSEAERSASRAKDLTSQLLTFSKGGAPILKAASIADILKESVSFALSGSKSTHSFALPDNLWSVVVDEGQMNQVINNIMINADQAMPQGGMIRIRAENVMIKEDDISPLETGPYVKVSIEDQGIGIPEEHLSQIFDPYFTTKQKGSGLGLAITYSVIKRHKGLIEVESHLGVGTTFHIYIPASPDQAVAKKEEFHDKPIQGKGRILVMDDAEVIRDILDQMLSKIGYEVVTTSDGFDTIESYIQAGESGYPFDAVIMDLTVPGGMGGIEAIEKLKAINPDIRAIVSSGYSNDPVMSNFREYGFKGVIAKPYRSQELSAILMEVLEE
jgi:PAS domain S-box-containing protein